MAEMEELTSQALSLPDERRAELAEILIRSLDEVESTSVKAAWLAEIRRRDQEIRAGQDVLRPADEVLREARAQLRCSR